MGQYHIYASIQKKSLLWLNTVNLAALVWFVLLVTFVPKTIRCNASVTKNAE